jgi:hypothetical protein
MRIVSQGYARRMVEMAIDKFGEYPDCEYSLCYGKKL